MPVDRLMKKPLSKSKLQAFRQCPKRLWLEVHRPELREVSGSMQANFAVGHQVGDVARSLYDPGGKGELIEVDYKNPGPAFARSESLLAGSDPIFEAGFQAEGALAFADVMLPVRKAGRRAWRMVEVKSSTEVKDYHRDDCAVQSFVARRAGVPLAGIALALIDTQWVYPGGGNYAGLLVETDLTKESVARDEEVRAWIGEAHKVVAKRREPAISTGAHCTSPYGCGFMAHCRSQEPQAEAPIEWLPRPGKKLMRHMEEHGLIEMRDAPDDLLNEQQQRVKTSTLANTPWFDRDGAARALRAHSLPAYFMDFETIQFAVPIWKGTRPYQQIPFQFSVHRLSRTGTLEQQAFLDLGGGDPSQGFARALLSACGERGPVFVYNASFETSRIRELAERFPRMKRDLLALNERVVDLLPVAREHYYHPSQHGSWSIKAVLPALCPELRYDDLDGVQDGGMAMAAYLEAIAPDTPSARRKEIEQQLLAYCKLDTYAMVRLWSRFTGKPVKD